MKKDKEFTIKKNILDNQYQKMLVSFQIIAVSIISGLIALSLYFYQQSLIDNMVNTLGYGFILISIFGIYFMDELYAIEEKILSLCK